jgi:hypothetical protein
VATIKCRPPVAPLTPKTLRRERCTSFLLEEAESSLCHEPLPAPPAQFDAAHPLKSALRLDALQNQ